MKTLKQQITILFIFCLFGVSNIYSQTIEGKNESYYGIEIDGKLCGYTKSTVFDTLINDKKTTKAEEKIVLLATLLGSNVNTEMISISHIDPITKKCSFNKMDINQGGNQTKSNIEIKDGKAYITKIYGNKPTEIEITSDIIFGDSEFLHILKRDFSDKSVSKKTYKILDPTSAQIQNSTITKIGYEEIDLAGKTYNAFVFTQLVEETGMSLKRWCDLVNEINLQIEVLNRKIYKTDSSVIGKIKVANMDESILTKTNVSIGDYRNITYMKLKAQIEPIGIKFSKEKLNVPGQSFTGIVNGNLIEGVFTIEHKKYNGENAPPFPTNFANDESLREYLEPGNMIESDDPVLIEMANKITKGSKNSWEAATRISKWVAENIKGAIPGGVTARKTFDMRAGECGAHSSLVTAFCRAVGIPARNVIGGAYFPKNGGSFGQHAWNEIYMGKAGWITVDATWFENDYVDSGHLRIGEFNSLPVAFNAKSIEVLDHRIGSNNLESSENIIPDKFNKFIGNYYSNNGDMNIKAENENLIVNIPGKAVLPLKDPDENGYLYCKIAPSVYCTFEEDMYGKIIMMQLHQIINMQKKPSEVKIDKNIPDEFKPYIGNYYFAAANMNFKVFYKDSTLAIDDPTENAVIKIYKTEKKDRWIDQYNKNFISFLYDDSSNVKSLKVDAIDRFYRGTLVANVIEKVIKSSGIKEGIKKYNELKQDHTGEYVFSETSFNALGYKLLNQENISEAIEIFKLNVNAYPNSWNVYDSLGEAFMKNNNKELAIQNYQKSLEINPENENGKNKLAELTINKN